MKYGIVGNRLGWTRQFVFKKLQEYNITSKDIIISGGAEGIDTYAQEYAKKIGAQMIVLYPKPEEPSPDRYFNRNKEIAEMCDALIAFDKGSSSGSGTLNTINHAKRLNKSIVIVTETI